MSPFNHTESDPKPDASQAVSAATTKDRLMEAVWSKSDPEEIFAATAGIIGNLRAELTVREIVRRRLSGAEAEACAKSAFDTLATSWDDGTVPHPGSIAPGGAKLRTVTETAFRGRLHSIHGGAGLRGISSYDDQGLADVIDDMAIMYGCCAADLAMESIAGRGLASEAMREVLLDGAEGWNSAFDRTLLRLATGIPIDRWAVIDLTMRAYWGRVAFSQALLDELSRISADKGSV